VTRTRSALDAKFQVSGTKCQVAGHS